MRIVGLPLLVVAALGLSACGGSDDDVLKDAAKQSEALQQTVDKAKEQAEQVRKQAEQAQQEAAKQAEAAGQAAQDAAQETDAAEKTDAATQAAQEAATNAGKAARDAAQAVGSDLRQQMQAIQQKIDSGEISEAEGEKQMAQLGQEATKKVIESMEASPEAREQMKQLAEKLGAK